MKGLVNIVDAPDRRRCILLYGDIGDWGRIHAEDVVRAIMEAERDGLALDVHINSVGGEIYPALSIFNALRASRASITIYIDCLAASAASVIASCDRPVQIADNGRLMIHSVRGGAFGTAQTLRTVLAELESLEEVLCGIYARRTGRTAEEIRAEYFDGEDHWLTAPEALRLGFVDAIFPGGDDLPDAASATPEQICDAYTNRYVNQLKHDKSMLNELRNRPRFADCVNEATAMQRIDELEQQAAESEALRAERDTLQAERDTLSAENAAHRAREEAAEEEALQAQVRDSVARGLISEAQAPHMLSLLHADRAAAEAFLGTLTPQRRVLDDLVAPTATAADPLEERKAEVRKKLGI